MSHSKRNTASALFTSHERSLLRATWGSRTTHLSRDSFLPFGSCRLCLLPARDPVSCATGGHVFCRECALANLLAQKKEIRRLEREWDVARAEETQDKVREEEERQKRERMDFERGMGSGGGAGAAGLKRKGDAVGTEADWAGAKKARMEGGDGRVSSSFWVPGEMQGKDVKMEKPVKIGSICPASRLDDDGAKTGEDDTSENKESRRFSRKGLRGAHEFTMKTLVTVKFTEEPDSTPDAPVRTCPACKKVLSNTTRAVMAKPCGHVLCKSCSDRFLKPPEHDPHDTASLAKEDNILRCYVCSEPASEAVVKLRDKHGREGKKDKEKQKIRPDLVEISCEGTGFASGGQNMIKKAGVAFQC